jgi:hypothetical protein
MVSVRIREKALAVRWRTMPGKGWTDERVLGTAFCRQRQRASRRPIMPAQSLEASCHFVK